MEEGALSAGLVVLPLALVARLIGPDHGALAVAQTTLPLAVVNCTCTVIVQTHYQAGVVLVRPSKGLLCLIALEVLALDFAR